MHGTKAFLPHLLRRPEALVVNVSSAFGIWGPPGNSAYAASKFAVRGFTESLRGELTRSKVLVVTVHPGGIRTAIALKTRIAEARDAAESQSTLRKFHDAFLRLTPEYAAAAIVRGLERDRERILIGKDAKRIDLLTRLSPVLASRRFNRRSH